MKFPVKLTKEPAGSYTVTFPDIPGAITYGANVEESLVHTETALESALDFYFEDPRMIPAPSKPKRGQRSVELPVRLCAKVLLLNEKLAQKVRPAELARRIGVEPQKIDRLLNPRYAAQSDLLEAAAKALDKSLSIEFA